MSPALAVRTATVCVLLAGIANARTDRRPVAVIDLSGEPEARTLALELGNLLVGDPALRPIDNLSMIAEITGELDDENRVPLQTAAAAADRAEVQLSQYSFAAAWSDADSGQESLHRAAPSTRAVKLYADLVFQAGRARLGENKDGEASELFALVHRLSPGRVLDPVRYQSFVIQAFEAAKFSPVVAKGTLAVHASGRVWVDGKAAPKLPVELEAGWHVVWVTGTDRATKGQRVRVESTKQLVLELPDDPADDRTKVRRARLALKLAPDPTARSAAMRRLAQLLQVRDAVLVSMANGRLIAQTWHERDRPEPDGLLPGFSAHRLVEANKPRELLVPLTPAEPAPVADPPPLRKLPPPPPEPPWYRRRSVLVSTAAGVMVVAIVTLLIVRSIPDRIAIDPNAVNADSPSDR